MFCGGLVLAIMILPIITAIGRDVLKIGARAQIEGTLALGATWWQSSWEMLHYSRSGLFGAVMLGLARAAGETMAITMVIGNNNQIHASLFAPAQTMSSLLANEFAEASTELAPRGADRSRADSAGDVAVVQHRRPLAGRRRQLPHRRRTLIARVTRMNVIRTKCSPRRQRPVYRRYVPIQSAVMKALCVLFTVCILAILASVTSICSSKVSGT